MKSDSFYKKLSVFKGKDPRRKIPGGSCLVEEVSTSRISNSAMRTYITIFEGGRHFVPCSVMVRAILCRLV